VTLLDLGVRRLESLDESERTDVRAALFEAAGNAYRGLGEFATAEKLLLQAEQLRKGDTRTSPIDHAKVLLSQASLTLAQGEFDRAEALARASLDILEREPGAPDGDRLNAEMELAEILRQKSRLDEASALVLKARERYAGKGESAGLARTTLLVGRIRTAQGRMEEAERELTRATELHERVFGSTNELTLVAKSALADTYVIMDKAERAEPILRQIVEGAQRIYGPSHLETAISLNNLANALSEFPEKYAESEKVYLEAATLMRAKAGPRHPELAITLNNIGALYLRMQEWEKARDAYRESVAIRVEAIGPNHPDTASAGTARRCCSA
jgi:tetratricopeptide (TPR) repeat protein